MSVAFLAIGGGNAWAATDVVLVFDTTGSMEGALDEAKSEIRDVVSTVNGRFDDVRYAVAAVSDYPDLYGDSGDRPWDLVQPLTADEGAIQTAIDGLTAAGGGDDAESYGRALYEANRDGAVGFRPGAQRLTVLVADNVPHDDNLNEGIASDDQAESSPFDTGIDPGPDDTVGTSDDIDWQPLLASLKARGMPLYFVLFKGDSGFLPYWRTWAGLTGGSASTSGDDALSGALVDSISAGAAGCSRQYTRLGNVDVCADRLETSAATGLATASGDVRLDDGVAVGDGPVVVDPAAGRIVADTATLTVVRGSDRIPVGTGSLTVDARAAEDPTSGRTNLSPMTFSAAPAPLGIGAIGLQPGANAYLDPRDGGGLVLAARPLFDLAGVFPTGELSLGVHANAGLRVLGGKAKYEGAKVFGSKSTAALSLAYEGSENLWKVDGELNVPDLFGAGISGALKGGKLDAFGVKAMTRGVPLGATGIVLDDFSGEVSGLSGATKKLTLATVGGYGPKLPKPINKHLLQLEKADISLDTALNGELKSVVGLVDRRVAGGDLDVNVSIRPSFRATGALNADVALLGTGWGANYRLDMDAHHFTGTGRAQFRVAGRTAQGAGALISDEGAGVSGKPCVICPTVGAGIRWRNVARFPPEPEWIGADIERFRTLSARSAAAGSAQRFRVGRGDVLLALTGRGSNVVLRGPDKRTRTLDRPGPRAGAQRTADGRWALTLARPARGRWRIAGSGAVKVQHVRALGTVSPRPVRPHTTKRKRLGKRRLQIRWRPRRLPAKARVVLTTSRSPKRAGRGIAGARATSGRLSVKRARLRKGANHLTLVVSTRDGIPFRRVPLRGTVWR